MTRALAAVWAVAVGLLLGAPGTAHAQNASVCIDPGHGGGDPGAVGNGLLEDELNLTASLAFRDWLELDNRDSRGGGTWRVFMTRDTDVFVSLTARADYANSHGVDYFMCIHTNAGGGDGTETFAYRSGTTADTLAHRVQEEILEHLGTRDRGVKYANFSVLVNTAMPADLAEMAFIDTWARNAELLSDDASLHAVGLAHLHALQRMVGLPAYTPSDEPPPPPPPPAPTGTVAFVTVPTEVGLGEALDVLVSYETNLAEAEATGQLVLQVKDGTSWELIEEVSWDDDGAGIVGPAAEHLFSVPAPTGSSTVFFVVFLTPRGAGWEERLCDASSLETPTSIVEIPGGGGEVGGGSIDPDRVGPAYPRGWAPPPSMQGGCAVGGASASRPGGATFLAGLLTMLLRAGRRRARVDDEAQPPPRRRP